MPRMEFRRVGIFWILISVNDNYEIRTTKGLTRNRAIDKFMKED